MLLWMAWTWQTMAFFGAILVALVALTLLAAYRPETPRRGIMGFATTRGDRFFVTMIGAGFIFVIWMRLGGGSLWYPLAASVLYGIAMFRLA